MTDPRVYNALIDICNMRAHYDVKGFYLIKSHVLTFATLFILLQFISMLTVTLKATNSVVTVLSTIIDHCTLIHICSMLKVLLRIPGKRYSENLAGIKFGDFRQNAVFLNLMDLNLAIQSRNQ